MYNNNNARCIATHIDQQLTRIVKKSLGGDDILYTYIILYTIYGIRRDVAGCWYDESTINGESNKNAFSGILCYYIYLYSFSSSSSPPQQPSAILPSRTLRGRYGKIVFLQQHNTHQHSTMAPKARIRFGASRIDVVAAAAFAGTDVRASAGELSTSRGGVVDEGETCCCSSRDNTRQPLLRLLLVISVHTCIYIYILVSLLYIIYINICVVLYYYIVYCVYSIYLYVHYTIMY